MTSGEHITAPCPSCGDELRAFVVAEGVAKVTLLCPRCPDVTVVMERTPADNPYQPEHYQLVGQGWRVTSVSVEGGNNVAIPEMASATTTTHSPKANLRGPADAELHDGAAIPTGGDVAVLCPDVRGLAEYLPASAEAVAPAPAADPGLRGAHHELSAEDVGYAGRSYPGYPDSTGTGPCSSPLLAGPRVSSRHTAAYPNHYNTGKAVDNDEVRIASQSAEPRTLLGGRVTVAAGVSLLEDAAELARPVYITAHRSPRRVFDSTERSRAKRKQARKNRRRGRR